VLYCVVFNHSRLGNNGSARIIQNFLFPTRYYSARIIKIVTVLKRVYACIYYSHGDARSLLKNEPCRRHTIGITVTRRATTNTLDEMLWHVLYRLLVIIRRTVNILFARVFNVSWSLILDCVQISSLSEIYFFDINNHLLYCYYVTYKNFLTFQFKNCVFSSKFDNSNQILQNKIFKLKSKTILISHINKINCHSYQIFLFPSRDELLAIFF